MTTTTTKTWLRAWAAPLAIAAGVASCGEGASSRHGEGRAGPGEDYGRAAQALAIASPGICSNDNAKACALDADCGAGHVCFLPTKGGETLHDQVCMQTAAGFALTCTADDVGVAHTSDLRIVKGCAYPGDTAIVSFVARVEPTANQRFDVGVWIAQDGGDARTGTCAVSSLPSAPVPPWTNLEPGVTADTCGDLSKDIGPAYASIENVAVRCVDTNGDGFVEVNACMTWKQPGDNALCTSPIQAVPGSPAKCNCQPLPGLEIPVPGVIVVDKVTEPSNDPTLFDFDLRGGPNGFRRDFRLADPTPPFATGPVDVGTYEVKQTPKSSWIDGVATCTSDQGRTPPPGQIVLHNGETVTCVFPSRLDDPPPALTVTKTNDADHGGGFSKSETVPGTAIYPWTVTYRLEIASTSTSDATIGSIVDDKTTSLDAPVSGLAPSCASLVGTTLPALGTVACYYDVTFANADLGIVTNIATVSATNAAGSASAADTSTVSFVQDARLSLTKTVDSPYYDTVGQVLTYTLTATNTGNTSLQNVAIADPSLASLTCTPAQPGTLAPGATITCTGSRTIAQADLDAGVVDNTATASGASPLGPVSASASASSIAHAVPSLGLTKSVTPATYERLGEALVYTLVATNHGNVTLNGVAIVDPQLEELTCDPAAPARLAPGASMTCTGIHLVTQYDLDYGSFANTASAGGTPFYGPPVEAIPQSVTATAIQKPSLSLTKVANLASYDAVGQTIAYTLVAKNTGNVTLQAVTIADPTLGLLDCTPAQGSTLAPEDGMTCTGAHATTQADLDAGAYENTASANAIAPSGAPIASPPAVVRIPAVQRPALTITKSATPTIYSAAGQLVTYTFTIANTGNVTLAGPFAVTDDRLGTFACGAATSLAPSASLACTRDYTILSTDLRTTYDGTITNTAFGTGSFQGQDVRSPSVTFTIEQRRPTAIIAPTETTCAQFAAGTAASLTGGEAYMVKTGAVLSVAPGVFFYYSTVTAPSSAFTVQVPTTIGGPFRPIEIQDLGQVILWSSTCTKTAKQQQTTFDPTTGLVTITVGGATPGEVFFLGVKYAPMSLRGQTVASPFPTVPYRYETVVAGTPLVTSWATVDVAPKR